MSATTQMELDLDLSPISRPRRANMTTEEAFRVFHEANPHVYKNLVAMARRMKAAGRRRIGVCLLYENLRWQYSIRTVHEEGDFKLPNNYKPHYARLIMAQEPDLVGIFQINRLQVEIA